MSVKLNHTIISVSDREASAAFLVDVLGLAQPVPYGPFLVVDVDNEASLDFMATAGDITSQHYAFLLSEDRFDEVFGRIQERGIAYYADPAGRRRGEINTNDGGRGCYFADPDGHWLEIITRPYASG
ncbi:MAG: VOC family protein [Acidimicrobiia bacterium]|nr:VOC family protein [Acidimicrobiia bacterium]